MTKGAQFINTSKEMANHTLAHYCITLKPKGHHDLRDANTTFSDCVKELWKTDRVTVIRIEVLVLLAVIILLFMATFGSWRRRSRNFFIQSGVLGAYTLSSSLVSYTLGSMYSSAVKSSLYPIWATSLYVLFGCVDSITAYSLNDNNQQTNQLFLLLLFQIYVMLIIRSDGILVSYVTVLASYKVMLRFWAYQLASGSWNFNKMVADYMYEEHSRSGPSYDPTSMKGYRYLVDWPLVESKLEAGMLYATALIADSAQVIDTERIWLCSGLNSELKDVCLSFSLFHLLRRRFFGFACAESSQQKTHDFVFKGLLLSKNEDGTFDYNRVFKVIEVELAFMYDFFFTKYAVLYYGSKKVSTIWSLASVSLICVTACHLAASFASNRNGLNFLHTTTSDVVITIVILACIALLESLQVLFYWRTIWGTVSFVCHYVREQAANTRGSTCMKLFQKNCCMRFTEIFLTKIIGVSMSRSSKCYYRNKLGQYSLVASVSYKHDPSNLRTYKFIKRNCSLFSAPDFGHLCETNKDIIHARSVRKGCGKPASVKLPLEVKKALVHSLQRTQGVLVSGESSLMYNEVHDLLWACRHSLHSDSGHQDKENQTGIIMTWHIATCYCEMATLKCLSPRVWGELKFHFDVATILSKYCAYLVVSAPKLLPGHHYDTSLVFDAVAVEAARFLRKADDKYEAMKSLPESTEMSIFRKGVKLGRQLKEMEDDKRWKVLSDFWAEMLLYIAPSDNVKEHIECLANGGEFLTHLWALLSHAGILDRGQRNVADIENAGTDQPYPGEGSYSPCTTCAATCTSATNQQAMSGNHVQRMVQQQKNEVQNLEIDREMESHSQGDVLNSEGSMHCTLLDFTEGTSKIEGCFRASSMQGAPTVPNEIEEIENAGVDRPCPGEISYSAAFRFRCASSYLNKCREGAAPATCAVNESGRQGNSVLQLEKSVEGGSTAQVEEMIRSREQQLKRSRS